MPLLLDNSLDFTKKDLKLLTLGWNWQNIKQKLSITLWAWTFAILKYSHSSSMTSSKNNRINSKKTLNKQKQPPEEFCKKGVLRNFAKFTGKHQCLSLFFNKVAGAAFHRTRLDDCFLKKQVCWFSLNYMIKYDENWRRKWKIDHIDTTWIDQGRDIYTNTVNTKCLRMKMLTCIRQHLSIEAQFMRTLSNTEAEMKNSVAYTKKCVKQLYYCFNTPLYELRENVLIINYELHGQTHSNNSSANCRCIVWVRLAILLIWRLKG